jgi:hypothetical protein
MSLSDWTRMQEAALLNRAKALRDELAPQTQGVNPPGTPYGITAAKVTALTGLIDAYEAVIGAPTAARSARKAKTADLRPRFAEVDVVLAGMDDLVLQFGGTDDGDLFVDGYFNARRIGGASAEEEEPAPPPPPPPPNP